MKIGILSLVYQNWNFGGLLQGYALEQTVRKFEKDASQLRVSRTEIDNSLKGRLMYIAKGNKPMADFIERVKALKDKRDLRNFRRFQRDYIGFEQYYNSKTIFKANKVYDCFIAGSDQIWNPKKFGKNVVSMFGLMFANRNKKKIAYAASVGAEQAIEQNQDLFRAILDNLDYISVRELTARDILQKYTEKKVELVLDPTLLLESKEWSGISVKPEGHGEYIFSYFLRERQNMHDNQMKSIANIINRKHLCISDDLGCYVREGDVQISDAGPCEFIGYIQNSTMVFTNSFHGMVFSIMFHRPFWVFLRNKTSDVKSMNNRVVDFLKMLGLENRIISDGALPDLEALNTPIDFEKTDEILSAKRSESMVWLEHAIHAE